jgi:hypothetical protein
MSRLPEGLRRMRRRPATGGRRPPGAAPVVYLVFDVLWLDGPLVTGLPLVERRGLLDGLGLAGPSWQTTNLFVGEPTAVFVDPKLAVRVRHLGWEAGRLRHAAYRGVA